MAYFLSPVDHQSLSQGHWQRRPEFPGADRSHGEFVACGSRGQGKDCPTKVFCCKVAERPQYATSGAHRGTAQPVRLSHADRRRRHPKAQPAPRPRGTPRPFWQLGSWLWGGLSFRVGDEGAVEGKRRAAPGQWQLLNLHLQTSARLWKRMSHSWLGSVSSRFASRARAEASEQAGAARGRRVRRVPASSPATAQPAALARPGPRGAAGRAPPRPRLPNARCRGRLRPLRRGPRGPAARSRVSGARRRRNRG